MPQENPTQIFGDDVQEERGENASTNNYLYPYRALAVNRISIGLSAFVGAIAVGDLVKTTLGPKGMDKILQSAYELMS